MKAFFAAIIILIILGFTFTALPADFAKRMQDSTYLNGIKDRVAGMIAKTFTGGKSPEETRLELINKIGDALQTLDGEVAGAATTSKSITANEKTPQELVADTQNLLEDLKSHNADKGLLRATTDEILSKVLPAQTACTANPAQN